MKKSVKNAIFYGAIGLLVLASIIFLLLNMKTTEAFVGPRPSRKPKSKPEYVITYIFKNGCANCKDFAKKEWADFEEYVGKIKDNGKYKLKTEKINKDDENVSRYNISSYPAVVFNSKSTAFKLFNQKKGKYPLSQDLKKFLCND
ncbi:hypothetical protein EBT25_12770, partial [bacterium]|nr:hypothetical protein [bacterium]